MALSSSSSYPYGVEGGYAMDGGEEHDMREAIAAWGVLDERRAGGD